MERHVNICKIVASTLLVMLSSLAMADTGRFCSYIMHFGLSNTDTESQQEEYSLRDCKKGDVIHIHITDADNLNREAMYLAGEIAEICDNTLPVTVVSSDRAVCTYRGDRRSIRRSE